MADVPVTLDGNAETTSEEVIDTSTSGQDNIEPPLVGELDAEENTASNADNVDDNHQKDAVIEPDVDNVLETSEAISNAVDTNLHDEGGATVEADVADVSVPETGEAISNDAITADTNDEAGAAIEAGVLETSEAISNDAVDTNLNDKGGATIEPDVPSVLETSEAISNDAITADTNDEADTAIEPGVAGVVETSDDAVITNTNDEGDTSIEPGVAEVLETNEALSNVVDVTDNNVGDTAIENDVADALEASEPISNDATDAINNDEGDTSIETGVAAVLETNEALRNDVDTSLNNEGDVAIKPDVANVLETSEAVSNDAIDVNTNDEGGAAIKPNVDNALETTETGVTNNETLELVSTSATLEETLDEVSPIKDISSSVEMSDSVKVLPIKDKLLTIEHTADTSIDEHIAADNVNDSNQDEMIELNEDSKQLEEFETPNNSTLETQKVNIIDKLKLDEAQGSTEAVVGGSCISNTPSAETSEPIVESQNNPENVYALNNCESSDEEFKNVIQIKYQRHCEELDAIAASKIAHADVKLNSNLFKNIPKKTHGLSKMKEAYMKRKEKFSRIQNEVMKNKAGAAELVCIASREATRASNLMVEKLKAKTRRKTLSDTNNGDESKFRERIYKLATIEADTAMIMADAAAAEAVAAEKDANAHKYISFALPAYRAWKEAMGVQIDKQVINLQKQLHAAILVRDSTVLDAKEKRSGADNIADAKTVAIDAELRRLEVTSIAEKLKAVKKRANRAQSIENDEIKTLAAAIGKQKFLDMISETPLQSDKRAKILKTMFLDCSKKAGEMHILAVEAASFAIETFEKGVIAQKAFTKDLAWSAEIAKMGVKAAELNNIRETGNTLSKHTMKSRKARLLQIVRFSSTAANAGVHREDAIEKKLNLLRVMMNLRKLRRERDIAAWKDEHTSRKANSVFKSAVKSAKEEKKKAAVVEKLANKAAEAVGIDFRKFVGIIVKVVKAQSPPEVESTLSETPTVALRLGSLGTSFVDKGPFMKSGSDWETNNGGKEICCTYKNNVSGALLFDEEKWFPISNTMPLASLALHLAIFEKDVGRCAMPPPGHSGNDSIGVLGEIEIGIYKLFSHYGISRETSQAYETMQLSLKNDGNLSISSITLSWKLCETPPEWVTKNILQNIRDAKDGKSSIKDTVTADQTLKRIKELRPPENLIDASPRSDSMIKVEQEKVASRAFAVDLSDKFPPDTMPNVPEGFSVDRTNTLLNENTEKDVIVVEFTDEISVPAMKLKPATGSSSSAIVESFIRFQGKVGPVESKGVKIGMAIIKVDGVDVSRDSLLKIKSLIYNRIWPHRGLKTIHFANVSRTPNITPEDRTKMETIKSALDEARKMRHEYILRKKYLKEEISLLRNQHLQEYRNLCELCEKANSAKLGAATNFIEVHAVSVELDQAESNFKTIMVMLKKEVEKRELEANTEQEKLITRYRVALAKAATEAQLAIVALDGKFEQTQKFVDNAEQLHEKLVKDIDLCKNFHKLRGELEMNMTINERILTRWDIYMLQVLSIFDAVHPEGKRYKMLSDISKNVEALANIESVPDEKDCLPIDWAKYMCQETLACRLQAIWKCKHAQQAAANEASAAVIIQSQFRGRLERISLQEKQKSMDTSSKVKQLPKRLKSKALKKYSLNIIDEAIKNTDDDSELKTYEKGHLDGKVKLHQTKTWNTQSKIRQLENGLHTNLSIPTLRDALNAVHSIEPLPPAISFSGWEQLDKCKNGAALKAVSAEVGRQLNETVLRMDSAISLIKSELDRRPNEADLSQALLRAEDSARIEMGHIAAKAGVKLPITLDERKKHRSKWQPNKRIHRIPRNENLDAIAELSPISFQMSTDSTQIQYLDKKSSHLSQISRGNLPPVKKRVAFSSVEGNFMANQLQNRQSKGNLKLKIVATHGCTSPNVVSLGSGELMYSVASNQVMMSRDGLSQRFFKAHSARVTCAAAHPNGSIVASGQIILSGSNVEERYAPVLIWDTGAQRKESDQMDLVTEAVLLHKLMYHREAVSCCQFRRDGKLLVTCGIKGDVALWHWATATLLKGLTISTEPIRGICILPKTSESGYVGMAFLVGMGLSFWGAWAEQDTDDVLDNPFDNTWRMDNVEHLYGLMKNKRPKIKHSRKTVKSDGFNISAVSVSGVFDINSDRFWIAVGCDDGHIQLWCPPLALSTNKRGRKKEFSSDKFPKSAKTSLREDTKKFSYSRSIPHLAYTPDDIHTSPVLCVDFHENMKRLVTAEKRGIILVWDVSFAEGNFPARNSVKVNALRKLLPFTSIQHSPSQFWESRDFEIPLSCSWDSDGMIAVGSSKNNVRLLDSKTGRSLVFIKGHKGPCPALAAHPSKPLFVTAGCHDNLAVLRVSCSQEMLAYCKLPAGGTSVAFDSSGEFITIGLNNGFVAIVKVCSRPISLKVTSLIDIHSNSDIKSNENDNRTLIASSNLYDEPGVSQVNGKSGNKHASRKERIIAKREAAVAAAQAARDGRVPEPPSGRDRGTEILKRQKAYELQRKARSQISVSPLMRKKPNYGMRLRKLDDKLPVQSTSKLHKTLNHILFDSVYGNSLSVLNNTKLSKKQIPKQLVKHITHAPSGKLMTFSVDSTLYIYSCVEYRCIFSGKSSGGSIIAIDWSTDSTWIRAQDEEYKLTAWQIKYDSKGDPKTKNTEMYSVKQIDESNSNMFSKNDSKEWSSWSCSIDDRCIGLWGTSDPALKITTMCRSRDGRFLITGSENSNVSCYNFPCKSNCKSRVHTGHSSAIGNSCFLADGTAITAGVTDGAIIQWKVINTAPKISFVEPSILIRNADSAFQSPYTVHKNKTAQNYIPDMKISSPSKLKRLNPNRPFSLTGKYSGIR